MPALPVLSGRKSVRAFEKLGWQVARQRGSHIIMVREVVINSIVNFESGAFNHSATLPTRVPNHHATMPQSRRGASGFGDHATAAL